MTDVNSITVGQIVTAIGVITAIGVFVGQVSKWIKDKTKPIEDFKEDLEELSARTEKIEEHQANDLEDIQDMKVCMRLLLRSTMALLAHGEDNNHTGELKNMEEEIKKYLIENA